MSAAKHTTPALLIPSGWLYGQDCRELMPWLRLPGQPRRQHIDLCGAPLRRALALCEPREPSLFPEAE